MISLVYSHKAGSVHCIITLDRYNNKIGPVSHFRQTRTLNAEHTFQVTLGVVIRNSVTRGKKSTVQHLKVSRLNSLSVIRGPVCKILGSDFGESKKKKKVCGGVL